MPEDWITTSEAAALSGYHPEYLRFLIRNSRIAGRKFGTVWQVSRKSLLQYMAKADISEDARWGPSRPRSA
jgi:excisionase family DNA binding protein